MNTAWFKWFKYTGCGPPTLLSWGHGLATTNNRTVVQYNCRTTTEHEQQHNIITTVTRARLRMCDATLNALFNGSKVVHLLLTFCIVNVLDYTELCLQCNILMKYSAQCLLGQNNQNITRGALKWRCR